MDELMVKKFLSAYDAWAKSDEGCGGTLFDQMVQARSDLEKKADQTRLSDSTRDELLKHVADAYLNGSFGDGMEMEYILDGCYMVGLHNISDEELVREYEQDIDYDEDEEPDELLKKAKMELAFDKIVLEELT